MVSAARVRERVHCVLGREREREREREKLEVLNDDERESRRDRKCEAMEVLLSKNAIFALKLQSSERKRERLKMKMLKNFLVPTARWHSPN